MQATFQIMTTAAPIQKAKKVILLFQVYYKLLRRLQPNVSTRVWRMLHKKSRVRLAYGFSLLLLFAYTHESVGAPPPTPVFQPTINPDTDGTYTLTWGVVPAARMYEIFEFTEDPPSWKPGSWKQINAWENKYTFKKSQNGTWYYSIRASAPNAQGQWEFSNLSTPLLRQTVQGNEADFPPAIPVLQPTVNPDTDGVYTLDWGAVSRAKSYEIFEFTEDPPSWSPGSWKQINAWENKYTFRKSQNGTWYYSIRAFTQNTQGQWINGDLSAPNVRQTVQGNPSDLSPATPVFQATVNPDTDGIYTLNWGAVPRANLYEIFEFTEDPPSWAPGSWKQINAWENKYTFRKSQNGTWYYSIRAFSRNTQGQYIYSDLSTPNLRQTVQGNPADLPPSIPVFQPTVNPDTDGTYTLSWGAVPRATQYEIFEFTQDPPSWAPGSWKQINAGDTKYTFIKPQNGDWYYSIRAFSQNTQGQTVFGDLSMPLIKQTVALAPSNPYADRLNRYASATVRYFTSDLVNNKLVGFTHAFYGTGTEGQWRDCNTQNFSWSPGPWPLNRGYGSHVNINEVTLRFLSLAAAYKMGWLDTISPDQKYLQSWGQIKKGLETLQLLQSSTDENKYSQGTFHRAYMTKIPRGGNNNADMTPNEIQITGGFEQSSDDNALPFMNLLILEGLAQDPSVTIQDKDAIVALCQQIRQNINLSRFIVNNKIVHNYLNGKPNTSPGGSWDREGAEGVPILAALLLSNRISATRFTELANSLLDTSVNWSSKSQGPILIKHANFHSALFMSGLRAIHGFPITPNEAPGVSFFNDSVKPVMAAQIDFAEFYGFQAFGTQPMTQTLGCYPVFEYWVGPNEYQPERDKAYLRQARFPGNEANLMPDPSRVAGDGALARATAPHGWFVPLSRWNDVDTVTKDKIFSWMAAYENEFFHGGPGIDELGWEAVIPWKPDDTRYAWMGGGRANYSDWGRPYEALNSAYTVLNIFDALNPNKPLASYSVAAEKVKHIAAYFDSGTPLPSGLFGTSAANVHTPSLGQSASNQHDSDTQGGDDVYGGILVPKGDAKIWGFEGGLVHGNKGEIMTFLLNPSASGVATISIFTMEGQEVKQISQAVVAGTNGIDWDLRNEAGQKLASGVYVANIKAPGVDKTRKIVMVK
ncbi:MAG: hypothetical protein KCHDKBKB_02088 [Elusimicrobia bacterium]|nr:hypothetical protein [Elusimicrobiota bacterium]